MNEKRSIGIIGIGMIGGSLALALKDSCKVVGYDTDGDVRAYAEKNGICTVVEPSAMRECEVIFVCVPIYAMKKVLDGLPNVVGDRPIITDVASVKVPFASTCGKYVGGHPMAGTERGGIAAAKAHLFENAYYVLTSNDGAAQTVKSVAELTGAIVIHMDAQTHDRAVAAFSHVPHAIAYAQVISALKSGAQPIAGSGFLDATRIAQSNEKFWTEVFKLNKQNVRDGIKAFSDELEKLDRMLADDNYAAIEEYLACSRQKRDALNRSDLGGEVLYVDLIDRVGEFERVTGAIARAGINVTNIALVPARQNASGALRLEFACPSDKSKAQSVLDELNHC